MHGSIIKKYSRDYYGGGLMMLLGMGAVVQGRSYDVGTLRSMGPGFFPVALGVLLTLLGAAIALSAKAAEPAERQPAEWRGWLCITLSIVAFIVIGQYGGLLPATFAVVFISALGDRQNTLKSACVLALLMTAICVGVFWWALQLQFPLFRWG